ncbi:MAG: hypothetical protein AAB425_01205, partial [Bdellovibrionota bacterium]
SSGLTISFDITDTFAWHDNAMAKSTCTAWTSDTTKYDCTFSGGDPLTATTDAGNANLAVFDILDDNALLPKPPGVSVTIGSTTTPGTSPSSTASGAPSERLYFGTGEYSAGDNWDAMIRIEAADTINSLTSGLPVAPDGTAAVKTMRDRSGIRLNFAHSFFVNETSNELYAASLFTTSDNHACAGTTEVCGSIGVIAGASSVNGSVTLSRHLFGSATTINQPHGIWIDTSRDILYAANTMSDNILSLDLASSVDGNTAPSRTISNSIGFTPVHLYVDTSSNRMFVACMGTPQIAVYNNASTLSGTPTPNVIITCPNTRLTAGNNQTTHNVWYDSSRSLLIVGHHTNEVLIYDLSTLNFTPTTTPAIQDLTPWRILKINEQTDDSDQYLWSAYGLFYLPAQDRLYVAAGYASTGTSTGSNGPPTAGTPENCVRVYDNVSALPASGVITPTRELWWSNGSTYYPPQALWVTLH